MDVRKLLLTSSVVITACGGTPSAPGTAGAPPFRSGAYVIDFIGDSFACGDVKTPQAGTAATVRLTIETSGNRSIATATGGGLTLQLQRDQTVSRFSMFSVGVAGTANGFAADEGYAAGAISTPPSGTRLTIDPSVPLTGEMPSPTVSDFALGALHGTVVFSRGGVTATCPAGAVSWTLNRLR